MKSEAENVSSDFYTAEEITEASLGIDSSENIKKDGHKVLSEASKIVTKRKRTLLEDDFFVLDHSFGKKGRRKEDKKKAKKTENTPKDESPLLSSDIDVHKEKKAAERVPSPSPEPVNTRKDRAQRRSTRKSSDNFIGSEFDKSSIEDKYSILNLSSDSEDDIVDLSMEFFSSDPRGNEEEYQFTEENEKTRTYILKVENKLLPPTSEPDIEEFSVKGTDRIESITKNILQRYADKYKSTWFETAETALIWAEGKREMKPFFTPSTLRIPPPKESLSGGDIDNKTICNCTLVEQKNVDHFLTTYLNDRINALDNDGTAGINLDGISWKDSNKYDADVINISSDEEFPGTFSHNSSETQSFDKSQSFFSIGLKGKDNIRINVEVSSETEIKKLLYFYLGKKKIDIENVDLSKAKLVFDDEALDWDSKVKDTELEEDFEVEVFI